MSSEEKTIPVECGMPSKLTFKYAHVEDGVHLVHSPKHGKVRKSFINHIKEAQEINITL